MEKLIFRNKLFIFLIMVSMCLLLTGCSSTSKSWSHLSYCNPKFNKDMLIKDKLAILPVIILSYPSEGKGYAEASAPSAPYTMGNELSNPEQENYLNSYDAYSLMLSEILLGKIHTRLPDINALSPGDTLKRINDSGLTEKYKKFKYYFPRLGLNEKVLKSFGTALKSRYLLISQAIISESESESTITLVWTLGHKATLRTVKINSQIWDSVLGEQVWEGTGIGYDRLAAYEKLPIMDEMASQAVNSLIECIAQ